MAYLNEATRALTSQLRLRGGVASRTLTGNVTCSASTEQFCFWDPGGSSRDVTLTAEETSEGLFHVFVNEADAAENLVIKNDAGSTVVTIGQNEWAIVACSGTAWADVPMSALADYLATANAWTAAQTFQNVLLGAASELTIASGAVAATRSYHTIDTEADAASDDLDDITGGAAGELLLVRPENAARTVVLRHAIGANKIATPGGLNISLAEVTDWALLVSDGTQWAVVAASTLANGFLAAANTYTGIQTFTGVRNVTSGATAITTTRAVTAADAGGVFTVDQGSAYAITVATPAGAGVRYLFQLVGPAANNVTIAATGCTFEGTIVNDVTSVIPATGSTLTFASGAAALGDTIELISTSASKFLVRAVTQTAGGITIA